MYRKESDMNTEELYKQYTQLLRGAPVDYGYRIAKKSPKHKALLAAFFRQKDENSTQGVYETYTPYCIFTVFAV